MSTFIPAAEGKFTAWASNFVSTLEGDPTTYGLTPEVVAELKDQNSKWDNDYATAVTKRDSAQAATVAKKLTRNEFEEMIRELAKQIQSNPTISEENRRDAGLPVHKSSRTPVSVPTSSPVARVDKFEPLAHVISFVDCDTPTRRGRPTGVTGCHIYVAVADSAPADPSDYRFVVQSTRSTARIQFTAEDGGKNAHYLLRWINTRGELGPWSTVLSSTIASV